MVDFVNAAPMVNDQGINDLSTTVPLNAGLGLPQHLPKFYVYAEKGPIGPTYVDMNSHSLTEIYGSSTFDVTKPFFTHQTAGLAKVAAEGNNCVIHRLYPDDGNDTANVTLWLDVQPYAAAPVYQKNTDGSIKLDVDGIPVPVSGYGGPVTVAGYKVAWVATRDSAKLDNNTFGCKEIGVGTIPNGASVRYPVLEFCASYPGSAGNAIGVTLAPQLQSDTSPFSATVFNESKNYPYTFMLKKIVNELTGKLGVVKNNFASTFANFLLEKNKRDTGTGAFVDAAKVISSAYVRTLDDINTNLLGYVHV
jgi:hypothetical protein